MKIQGRNVACVAILIASKSIDGVRKAVWKGLRGLKGRIGNDSGIVRNDLGEIRRTMVLSKKVRHSEKMGKGYLRE